MKGFIVALVFAVAVGGLLGYFLADNINREIAEQDTRILQIDCGEASEIWFSEMSKDALGVPTPSARGPFTMPKEQRDYFGIRPGSGVRIDGDCWVVPRLFSDFPQYSQQ